MEYQDASHTGSTVHSEPVARPDVDTLPAGSYGPATGNAITGAGTSTGASGADTAAAGATIVEVQGAGGASNHADGNFQANGQYGVLSMDAQGDFSYVRNPGTPDGVKDVFHYTLANAAGANSSTTLTIDIGEVAAAAAGQGVVMLPAGVEMSDIHVNGRDLVIDMPNGTQMVIPNGAVFVPQLTIGDVQVPPTNLAALLIDSEPQPAAGPPQSSGGNFAEPVPPLDPGVPLGDLIPPTELSYTPPEFRPVGQFENTKPTVVIETPDNPAGVVDASESVKEAGLPTRNGGEPAGSGEIADGNPSNNSDGSETNTGTIVFTAQDGLGSITVGGTAVTAVGQQIQGQYGVMTITGIDIAHGQITYSYTLSDNTSGDSTQDVFSVVVTDRDGDTATGSLTVHIVDDVPTARNDTDATDNSTHVAAGNVMTGAGTTSGASGADTVGADNAHLTAVSGAGGSDSTADSSGNFQVAGHYGMLTINADGTYTYTLNENAPGGSVDTFTYTLTDGDGDTSTATLTISNPNHVPTLSVPTEGQAGTVVDEKGLPPHGDGLPAGSGEIADQNPNNNSDQSETTTGTITFTPGDAPAVVTIDGVAVTGTVGQTFTGDHGTLTITGYNANGSIQYSYTLTDSTSGDHTTDSFSVVVTDSDGDHANGTLTIDIVDDVPTAHADINTVSEGGTVTGNVESNDVSGADGFASGGGVTGVESGSHTGDVVTTGVGTPVTGLYGTLTLQADGSYSYHANPNTNPPSGATDVFTYTITDGDGDTSTTTLTINVNDVVLNPQNPTVQVNEAALDTTTTGSDLGHGSVTGSNPSSPDETVSGQLSISGIGSTGYDAQSVTTDHGIFQLNADGSYTYTLTSPFTGSGGNDGTAVDGQETFTYTAHDANGNTVTGTITVNVLDDVPTAVADTGSVSEGGTVTGNVESNDVFGADGKASGGGVTGVESGSHTGDVVTTGVGTPVTGLYGTLTLQADGSYSYHANPNTNPPSGATDVFTYTITDGDGDTSTTTLTINVNDVTLVADNQDKTVYESALDLNKDGADLAAGTVTGSNPSSTGETVQGQLNVSGATGYTVQDVTTANGVFHLNANGSYTYTLTTPVDEATADNGPDTQNNVESFTYTAHDANGNTVTGTITIDVVDDVPTARSDADSVTEDGATVADGNAITGVGGSDANSTDGVADTPGADGATITGIKLPASGSYTAVSTSSSGTQIVGTYGTLTIHSDGSYSYQLNNSATNVQALHVGQQVTDTFNYQLTDGDGDTSLANIVITVNGSNDAPVVGSATVSVSEEGLMGANPDSTGSPDTTNSVTASGTISMTDVDSGDAHTWTLTAPANGSVKSDGYNVIWTGSGTGTLHAYQDVNGNGQVDSGEKAIATITIDNTGHYTVTLQGPIDHPTANVEDATSFGVTVNVNDGTTTSTGTLTVSVEDDSPVNFTPVSLTDTTGATATTLDNAIVNDGTAVVTAFLNDTNSDPSNGEKFIGADGFGSLAFTTGTHTNGEVLKDANGTTLTSGGQTIYVFGYGTDTLTATTDANYATDHNAASVVFTVHLTEGAGYGENSTYTIDFNQTIDDGSGITVSKFGGAPAGQSQWIGLDSDLVNGQPIAINSPTDPNPDSPDLLLTPTKAGGTVNTSSTDIGSSNQWIGGGEGIRIDYVTDVTYGSGNEKTTGGYMFDGHYAVSGTSFKIMQEQGSGSGSAVRIAAYNDPDTGNITTLSGSLVAIDPASITVTGDTSYSVINMGDGTFVITGLAPGAVVTFNSLNNATYDAISITNASGTANPNGGNFSGQDFSIGQFGYFTAAAGHDIPLSFGVTATDADGDTSTGTINVTLEPNGSTSSAATTNVVQSNASVNTTLSLNTESLIATNDNGHQDHRSFSAGNNAALMGALAAAGLTGMEHVHANQAVEHSHGHGPEMMPLHSAPVFSPAAHAGGGDVQTTHVIASDTLMASDAHSQHGGPLHATPEATHGLAGENAGHAAQLAELLHGSEGAAHATPHATAAMTAATVIMPSAQQLAAMTPDSAVQPQASVAGEAQHNQVVGKVLADALHGGGDHGHHDVDSLVHSLHHGNGGDPTMEALATHGHAAVSIGHMAFAGAFGGGHMMSSMDSVAHPDAAPVHG